MRIVKIITVISIVALFGSGVHLTLAQTSQAPIPVGSSTDEMLREALRKAIAESKGQTNIPAAAPAPKKHKEHKANPQPAIETPAAAVTQSPAPAASTEVIPKGSSTDEALREALRKAIAESRVAQPSPEDLKAVNAAKAKAAAAQAAAEKAAAEKAAAEKKAAEEKAIAEAKAAKEKADEEKAAAARIAAEKAAAEKKAAEEKAIARAKAAKLAAEKEAAEKKAAQDKAIAAAKAAKDKAKADADKAAVAKTKPSGDKVAATGAAAPASQPAPSPDSKEGKLAALLEQYKADKISPAEYHQRRAEIISAP